MEIQGSRPPEFACPAPYKEFDEAADEVWGKTDDEEDIAVPAKATHNRHDHEASTRQSDRGGAAAGAMALDGSHHTTSSGKMERKDVEKNRRLHMKGLCLKLSSLVPASSTHHLRHYSSSSSSPPSSNKDAATQLDQLDSAAAYIKQLRARIEDLKRRKQAALSGNTVGCSSSVSAGDYKSQTAALPVIEVRHQDGTLDVALASEAGRPFRLHEVMAVLEQEGAEVSQRLVNNDRSNNAQVSNHAGDC
uniref:Uncharacterized protein n=1 Tax=Aegilops tauschii TaxID=37682 RepID=M8ATP2_AEGTA